MDAVEKAYGFLLLVRFFRCLCLDFIIWSDMVVIWTMYADEAVSAALI